MPQFEGHSDSGLEPLLIEIPAQATGKVVWKWPDRQIVQFSQLNVDFDHQTVFTSLGKVIGVMGPGRYRLDEGAPLALGWLVDRLTADTYYDAEVYFVSTREHANVEFGGPLDDLTDGPSGLVVTLRVHGELAFRVIEAPVLLARLIGTGAEDFDAEVSTWVTDQTLAAIRSVLPEIVAEHGVLAAGRLQDATSHAALAKANETLRTWGLSLSAFAELSFNLPDADAEQLERLAATTAHSAVAGSLGDAARGQAALEIPAGIANGNGDARQGTVAGMTMGVTLAGAAAPANGSARTPTNVALPRGSATPLVLSEAPPVLSTTHFCTNCGKPVLTGAHLCTNCGAAVR